MNTAAAHPLSKLLRWMIWLLSLALIAIVAASLWAGFELASPPRRVLQDYHREFLADTAAHGVQVQSFSLKDRTPCLMVTPLASGQIGSRGEKVREQLIARGLRLSAKGQVIGTLVLVHGRKGRKEDYLLIAERLCAAGFRCLLPDMPGHGDHPTEWVTFGLNEHSIPARALHEAAENFHFQPQPAGLLGMSMGGAVAMRAAATPSAEWQALVIISSFDDLTDAIRQNVATRVGSLPGQIWTAGAGIVYRVLTGHSLAEIRSDISAEKINLPTLIAHGSQDRVIPFASGQRLFAALPAALKKEWITVPEAGHDNVLITDFPIYATVAEWFLRYVRAESRPSSP